MEEKELFCSLYSQQISEIGRKLGLDGRGKVKITDNKKVI